MSDKIFVKGILFKRPEAGTPEWIKGKLAINPEILAKFAEENKAHKSAKGWLKIDLKNSKDGTLYLELNTWKPQEKTADLQPIQEDPTLKALRDSHNAQVANNKITQEEVDSIPF